MKTRIEWGRIEDGGIWIIEYLWDNSKKIWVECGRISLTQKQWLDITEGK